MRVDFTTNYDGPRWGKILRDLKSDSGLLLYDHNFEAWALEKWGIKFLHESAEYPDHLTGVEMADDTYTLLLIKFNAY